MCEALCDLMTCLSPGMAVRHAGANAEIFAGSSDCCGRARPGKPGKLDGSRRGRLLAEADAEGGLAPAGPAAQTGQPACQHLLKAIMQAHQQLRNSGTSHPHPCSRGRGVRS